MRWRRIAAHVVMLAGLGASWTTGAATITNRESEPRTLTIIEGGVSKEHVVKPSAKLENVCIKGCVVRLGQASAGEWELTGDEIVSIEDGFLYYDPLDGRPPTETGATPGAKPQPRPGG